VIRADDGSKAFAGVSCIQDEMSREMQQRKLFEGALDRARSADSAKSTFLTNMSHDIRTPMNAIIGFTNIAATHLDDKEKVKDALDKIRTSSDHLMRLINDVLDMSRIESGRLAIKEKKNSLTEIAGGIEKILQPQIQSKKLTFAVDMDSVTAPDVYCDETRITQLLLNLLGNSVKYTEPGGKVTLSIRQKKNGKARRYNLYEFVIEDNGIGFETQPAEAADGKHIGLSNVRERVERMCSGSMEIDSRLGEGTRIVLKFPVQEERNLVK
jgi:signal transduction histidine kinase